MDPMRLLLVDDHILFREGLVSLLEKEADMIVVGEAGTVEEAVTKAEELRPDLVLLDIKLPDGSGLEALRRILTQQTELIVVMISSSESDEHLFEALRSGAKGYLLKNSSIAMALSSLRSIKRGEAAISREMTHRVLNEFSRIWKWTDLNSSDLDSLTTRELEVLKEIGKGGTNREIADRLFIAENTVKIHVRNILSKLKLHNRREAARFAQRLRLGGSYEDSESSTNSDLPSNK